MTKLIVYILYCILFVKVGAAQLNCDADSTGLISLVDLQEDNYLGFQGGLYPEGSNFMPAEHKTDGLNIARTIKPLDSLGNVDWENGKIVFLGMGASVAGNPWNNVINLTKFDTDLNPCMQLINACVGSKGLNIMVDLMLYPALKTSMQLPIRCRPSGSSTLTSIWERYFGPISQTVS
jgi:hypothetical protein